MPATCFSRRAEPAVVRLSVAARMASRPSGTMNSAPSDENVMEMRSCCALSFEPKSSDLGVAFPTASHSGPVSSRRQLKKGSRQRFDSGSPEKAGPERVKCLRERLAPLLQSRARANAEAAARLH